MQSRSLGYISSKFTTIGLPKSFRILIKKVHIYQLHTTQQVKTAGPGIVYVWAW